MHPHVFLGFFCILLWIDCIFCQAHNLTGASIPVSSPMQRFGHSTVLLPNGSLLIFGGHNYQLTNVELKTYIGLKNDLYLFDFATQNYTRINPERNTSLPSPRVHHSAVLLTDANGALRMRIFGGMTWLRYRGLRSTPFTMCGDDSVWDYIIDANVWVVVSSGSGTCAAGPNSVGTTKIDFLLLLLLATLYVIL